MYCSQCGTEAVPGGKFCTKCGAPLQGQSQITTNTATHVERQATLRTSKTIGSETLVPVVADGMSAKTKPLLWNPNAAANWSLLLSVAFGAYLHAVNWRELGKPEQSRANMVWFWVFIFDYFAHVMCAVFSKQYPELLNIFFYVFPVVDLSMLVAWYFIQGRKQVNYIKDALRDEYEKKGWAKPILIGILSWVAWPIFLGIGFAIFMPQQG